MFIKLAAALTACLVSVGCKSGAVVSPPAPPGDASVAVAPGDGATITLADGAVVPADVSGMDNPFHDPATASPVPGAGAITLAGSGESGLVDGSREVARFNNPTNVALGPDGNLYVADYENGAVRLVRPNGMTLTFTRQAGFSHPFGLAFAADGTLYAQTDADEAGNRANGTIWRLDRRTGAGTIVVHGVGRPRGLLVLPDGRLVIVDSDHHTVRLLNPVTRVITDLAGTADAPGFADGRGAAARFDHPNDVVLGPSQRLIVADQNNHRLRAVTLDGDVSTYAGTGQPGAADGTQLNATFNHPQALAIDSDGNVFVSDLSGYDVRRIAVDGTVTTVAGAGRAGYSEGEALQAMFFGLEGIDVSPSGESLYVADGNRGGAEASHRIRRVALSPDTR